MVRHSVAGPVYLRSRLASLEGSLNLLRNNEITGLSLAPLSSRGPFGGAVRIRVEASGVRHSDALAVHGMLPDPAEPIVPGHEVIGLIEAVAAGVSNWKIGDRVGVPLGSRRTGNSSSPESARNRGQWNPVTRCFLSAPSRETMTGSIPRAEPFEGKPDRGFRLRRPAVGPHVQDPGAGSAR